MIRDIIGQITYFYPRPPRGGRPRPDRRAGVFCGISIHALREEGDYPLLLVWYRGRYFYPRPPRGGRHSAYISGCTACNFYPRPPRGGRPKVSDRRHLDALFLSTPSARRATVLIRMSFACTKDFYPRPPRGGRQHSAGCRLEGLHISIHALREEGDQSD